MRILRAVPLVGRLFASIQNASPQKPLSVNEELIKAVSSGDTAKVKALIAAKADVNAKSSDASTPLYIAAGKGHTTIVQALLAAGAQVNAGGFNGLTPLHSSAGGGHAETVKALVAAGADVNVGATGCGGPTPLLLAAGKGHLEIVRTLIAAGADVNAKSKDFAWAVAWSGRTPLHDAAENGHTEIVLALITGGADVNAKQYYRVPLPHLKDEYVQPLHRAARMGRTEIVKMLIEAGADLSAVDVYGQTPPRCAILNRHTEIARVFAEANARKSGRSIPKQGTLEVITRGLAQNVGVFACTEIGVVDGRASYLKVVFSSGSSMKRDLQSGLVVLEDNEGKSLNLKYREKIYVHLPADPDEANWADLKAALWNDTIHNYVSRGFILEITDASKVYQYIRSKDSYDVFYHYGDNRLDAYTISYATGVIKGRQCLASAHRSDWDKSGDEQAYDVDEVYKEIAGKEAHDGSIIVEDSRSHSWFQRWRQLTIKPFLSRTFVIGSR